MKTRQEMIYDFMLALAPTFQKIQDDLLDLSESIELSEVANTIYFDAVALADEYLSKLG